LEISELIDIYLQDENTGILVNHLETLTENRISVKGLVGSSRSVFVSSVFQKCTESFIIILPDKESAAYFHNDLESIFAEKGKNFHKKKILFFPTSYKRKYDIKNQDSTNILQRTEVLKRLGSSTRKSIIVTYPEALAEKVVRKSFLTKNTIKLKRLEPSSIDDIADKLIDNDFDQVDFVYEPGQFALRGGIIDVFSFTNDYPYRIEFFGNEVESIRSFNPADQLSVDKLDHITIVPNVQDRKIVEKRVSFLFFIPDSTILWFEDLNFTSDKIAFEYDHVKDVFEQSEFEFDHLSPEELFIKQSEFNEAFLQFSIIEFGNHFYFKEHTSRLNYNVVPQPSFNKNFDLLIQNLNENTKKHYQNFIFSDNPSQLKRLYSIFDDIHATNGIARAFEFETINIALHEGFLDHDKKIACYTDHQIFFQHTI